MCTHTLGSFYFSLDPSEGKPAQAGLSEAGLAQTLSVENQQPVTEDYLNCRRRRIILLPVALQF